MKQFLPTLLIFSVAVWLFVEKLQLRKDLNESLSLGHEAVGYAKHFKSQRDSLQNELNKCGSNGVKTLLLATEEVDSSTFQLPRN